MGWGRVGEGGGVGLGGGAGPGVGGSGVCVCVGQGVCLVMRDTTFRSEEPGEPATMLEKAGWDRRSTAFSSIVAGSGASVEKAVIVMIIVMVIIMVIIMVIMMIIMMFIITLRSSGWSP